jgi:hypothetical protein
MSSDTSSKAPVDPTVEVDKEKLFKKLRTRKRIVNTKKKKKSWKQSMMRYHFKNGRHGRRRKHCKERKKNSAPRL